MFAIPRKFEDHVDVSILADQLDQMNASGVATLFVKIVYLMCGEQIHRDIYRSSDYSIQHTCYSIQRSKSKQCSICV